MNLKIILASDKIEVVNTLIIDKLYRLSYEDQDMGITSQITSGENDIVGYIRSVAAYEDAVEYLRAKFPNLTIDIPNNNYYIRFKDSAVGDICISNWGDGIGLSKSSAASVSDNDIEKTFNFNEDITSFDELSYFTSVISLPYFQGCHNLTSIGMENIQYISRDVCKWAYGLKTINAPNLVSLGRTSFVDCTSLEEIISLGTAEFETSYGGGQFNGCTSLKKVHLPDTLAILPGAFSNCNKIEEINFPETLTTIQGACFYGALVNGFVVYLPNVTYVDYPFTNNSGARYVYMPRLPKTTTGYYLKTQWQRGFMCGSTWGRSQTFNVLYFRDITNFGAWSFAHGTILNLVINNNTPPTIISNEGINPTNGDTFTIPNGYEKQNTDIFADVTSIVNIYVPDNAVSAYQAAPGFESVSSKIKALSLMNKVATREEFDALSDTDKVNTLIEEYM